VGSLRSPSSRESSSRRPLHRTRGSCFWTSPRATLPSQDVERLLTVLRSLQERGVSLIYISTPLRRGESSRDLLGAFTRLRATARKSRPVRRARTRRHGDRPRDDRRQLQVALIGEALMAGEGAEDSGDRASAAPAADEVAAATVEGLSDGSVLARLQLRSLRRGDGSCRVAGLIAARPSWPPAVRRPRADSGTRDRRDGAR
jgi:hypothetical protein